MLHMHILTNRSIFFGGKKFTTFNSTDGQRCFPYNIIADIVAYYPLNRIIQTYLILINDLQQFYYVEKC